MRILMILCLLAGPWLCAPAFAAERYALVMGNNAYPNLAADEQLRKAVNDADAVGDTLERLGFTVMRGTDLGRSAMLARLSAFRQSLQPGDTGFVYFSGHGVAIDGANYLLPADIPDSADEDIVIQSAVAETYVEGLLSKAGVKTGILVLDACRNNPFTTTGQKAIGGAKGLMRADPPGGVFKLYAAGTGETALDRLPGSDPDPNSVFTRILLPELERPGQSLVGVAYAVKAKVTALAATVGHAQHPAQYDGGFANTVYLAGEAPRPDGCSEAKAHYEEAARRNSASALRAHIKFYGTCAYAPFAEEALAALAEPVASSSTMPGMFEDSAGEGPARSIPPALTVPRRFTQRLLTDGGEIDAGPGSRDAGASPDPTKVAGLPNGTLLMLGADEGWDVAPMSPIGAATAPATTGAAPAAIVDERIEYRALLYREKTDTSPGSQTAGTVRWSLLNEPPGEGHPAEPVVRATIDLPAEKLSATITVRRNADPTLPASHLFELMFLPAPEFVGGSIADFKGLALKPNEQAKGEPLLGVSGKISENLFLLALNDLADAHTKNIELMVREQWIDVPLVTGTGKRMLLTFQKGRAGNTAFALATAAWSEQKGSTLGILAETPPVDQSTRP